MTNAVKFILLKLFIVFQLQVANCSKPLLSIPDPYIHDVADGPIPLNVKCIARTKIQWITHIPQDYYELTETQNADEFISTFKMTDPISEDTGRITCLDKNGEQTSSYIYVSGIGIFKNSRLLTKMKISVNATYLILDCATTHPRVEVEVLREHEQIPSDNIDFDPKLGVRITGLKSFDGYYECRPVNFAGKSNTFDVSYGSVDNTVFDPRITKYVNSYFVVNHPFTLVCSVPIYSENDRTLHLKWDLPAQNRSPAQKNFNITEVKKDKQIISTLRIHQATLNDSGTYICTAHKRGESKKHSVNITVIEKQQSFLNVTSQSGLRILNLEVGEDVLWVLIVRAYPSNVTFLVTSDANNSSNKAEVTFDYMTGNMIVTVKNVQQEDFGRYNIEVTNGLANDSDYFVLFVQGPPVIELPKRSTCEYRIGQRVNMTAVVLSHSSPNVSWFYSSDCPVGLYSDCFNLTEVPSTLTPPNGNESNGWLTTISLDTQIPGLMEVQSVNDMGRVSQSSHFALCGKYGEFFFNIETETGLRMIQEDNERIDIFMDDTVTFACGGLSFLYSNVSLVPKYQILKSFLCSDSHYHKQCMELRITNVSMTDTVVCKVEKYNSKIKTLTADLHVLTTSPPALLDGSNVTKVGEEVRVKMGNPFHLSCLVSGRPPPIITWYKDNDDITKVEGFLSDRLKLENNSQTLNFSFAEARHSGNYICRTENRVGRLVASAEVLVTGRSLSKGEVVLIVLVSMAVVTLIFIVVYLYVKIQKEKKLRLEFRRNQLYLFAKGNINDLNPDCTIDEQADLLPYDSSYEVERDKITLGRVLGSGAFGRVMYGEVDGLEEEGRKTKVAVKMVKDLSDPTHLRALTLELKIMIHIGRHLNIVNLMGASSINILKGELWILVEYCKFGQLLQFVIKNKSKFVNQINPDTGLIDPGAMNPVSPSITSSGRIMSATGLSMDPFPEDQYDRPNAIYPRKISEAGPPGTNYSHPIMYVGNPQYHPLVNQTSVDNQRTSRSLSTTEAPNSKKRHLSTTSSIAPSLMGDKIYDSQGNTVLYYDGTYTSIRHPFSTLCLLSWSWQVAVGMEYLSSRKVLHSDLAARNLLLSDHNVVKISDFGLSRDMYKKDVYVKKEGDILPIKWMSLEAIQRRQFSTQSDVWAYGITLWEIFSLGRTPYPEVPINHEFVIQLEKGMRLPKPKYATGDIYDLMYSCWKEEPEQRPSFSEIVSIMENMLNPETRENYVAMNDIHKLHNEQYFGNNKDYIDMLSSPDFNHLQSTPDDELVEALSPDPSGYLAMDSSLLSSGTFNVFSPRPDSNDDHNKFDFTTEIDNCSPQNESEFCMNNFTESDYKQPSKIIEPVNLLRDQGSNKQIEIKNFPVEDKREPSTHEQYANLSKVAENPNEVPYQNLKSLKETNEEVSPLPDRSPTEENSLLFKFNENNKDILSSDYCNISKL